MNLSSNIIDSTLPVFDVLRIPMDSTSSEPAMRENSTVTSSHNYLVAVVVSEQSEIMTWCEKNAITGTWENLCENLEVKQHILQDMQRIGKEAGLLSFQQVKDIYLHPVPLTIEEGHLTPTQKTKRDIVKKLFMKNIQDLYSRNL